jgi:prepilin-type N-terminal cleavage/methylation domain-containing protein
MKKLNPVTMRSGVTLTEVLMSLMIMSIGISSVAVLFPISVLRSVQATQLTNAAILKRNAQSLLDMRQELIFDPDGDGNFNEHIGAQQELNYIVDPSGYFEMATGAAFSTASYSNFATLSNNNDATKPNDSTLRGGADWFGNVDTNADGIPEPLLVLPRYDGGVRVATIPSNAPIGFRPQGGDPEEARALRLLGATLSKLGDAWDTQFDAIPEQFVFDDGTTGTTAALGSRIVGIKFAADADLSAVPTSVTMLPAVSGSQIIPDPEICRVVVFSLDGNFSVALPLIAIDNAAKFAVWSEDTDFDKFLTVGEDLNQTGAVDIRTLPQQFYNSATGSYAIGRVVLQSSRTHDYNWLLTVRRARDGQARGLDVVITHNKDVTPDNERLYSASFDTRTTAFNNPYVIEVFKSGGLQENGEAAVPAIKKSGYVLDIQNARWYRVLDYIEQDVTIFGTSGPITAPGYTITLETPVLENSPFTFDADSGAAVDPRYAGHVMFLPGVIDVYPMGSIARPGN